VWVVVAVLFALGATTAGAVEVEGPQLAMSMISLRTFRSSLVSIDPESSRSHLLRGPNASWSLILNPVSAMWSPDGADLAVGAISSAGKARPEEGLYLLRGGRGKLHPISGTDGGSHPVFSPDGATLAFAKTRLIRKPHSKLGDKPRFEGSSVWLIDLAGGPARQLTPWRNGLSVVPSSFSPDGQVLAATREAHSKQEAIALSLSEGSTTVLAQHGEDPTYSSDGSKIAYLKRGSGPHGTASGPTDIVEMNTDGSGSMQLTDTPKAGEAGLAWSPSGARLAFVRLSKPRKGAGILSFRTGVFEMNADGTCARRILTRPKTIAAGLSWRPGPGRDPGPIVC
jgi:dipeptidyl aminopeptidase/acylaminoacyl peptidase